jgi:hypothetical protein
MQQEEHAPQTVFLSRNNPFSSRETRIYTTQRTTDDTSAMIHRKLSPQILVEINHILLCDVEHMLANRQLYANRTLLLTGKQSCPLGNNHSILTPL